MFDRSDGATEFSEQESNQYTVAMASAGEALFGSKVLWKIGVIIVLFVVISTSISQCSADKKGKVEHALMVSEATPDSAKEFCFANARELYGKNRDVFRITDSSIRQASELSYYIEITYKAYASDFTGTVYPGSTTCHVQRQMYGWYKYSH